MIHFLPFVSPLEECKRMTDWASFQVVLQQHILDVIPDGAYFCYKFFNLLIFRFHSSHSNLVDLPVPEAFKHKQFVGVELLNLSSLRLDSNYPFIRDLYLLFERVAPLHFPQKRKEYCMRGRILIWFYHGQWEEWKSTKLVIKLNILQFWFI